MDINEKIKEQISNSNILLYMKGTPDFPQCGFSAQSVAALRAVGANFEHFNIFEDEEIREGLKVFSNWPTFPQLYVNGELIGGCDIIMELYEKNELKDLLVSN
ncbi:MAG: Grx4 family monothiol glutaredoxin [Pseudomonadota bacterium]|nr:monothiol glutaredoxin, Grx4 family [Gammaproteobacteria bacterium]MEE2684558.1 Grx4 family monothiol glutaredoxin [Pseudomonadota bacterium]|tara:strand:- start:1604 stop:1912 length:309 start_codon:yes stop_codon:yes gene_type:complete